LKARMDLAEKYNLGGVAIWDLANGSESFLDEF
jgi:spore germination protein YaaH